MPQITPTPRFWMRRLATDAGLFVAAGVMAAFLGPFGTSERPLAERLLYWLIVIPGGSIIAIVLDGLIQRRLTGFWLRLLTASLATTPFVTVLVVAVNAMQFNSSTSPRGVPSLLFQVFIVSFAVMALRQLAWAQTTPPPTIAPKAEDDPTAAFRRRLSAKRRDATLYAVEAEDHYLRVHTGAGEELVTARFADALAELAAARGFRTHRSWWVAAGAIEEVRWIRGRGDAQLANGLVVPVSRSQAGSLKAAGWFPTRRA